MSWPIISDDVHYLSKLSILWSSLPFWYCPVPLGGTEQICYLPFPSCLQKKYRNRNPLQSPPQALRFSHGRGERETRVTGNELQGTTGRVQTAGEATSQPLSSSRLPLRAHFHWKREVWERGRTLSLNQVYVSSSFLRWCFTAQHLLAALCLQFATFSISINKEKLKHLLRISCTRKLVFVACLVKTIEHCNH